MYHPLRSPLRSALRRTVHDGRAGARTPLSVLGARLLAWEDPSDLSLQWSDVARTTPAVVGDTIASSQLKGLFNSIYMQQAVAASRAQLLQDASGIYRYYDGSDDSYGTSSQIDLSTYNKLTIISAVRKESDAASGRFLELTTSSGLGSFAVTVPHSASASLGGALRGAGTVVTGGAVTYTSPVTAVVTNFFDLTQITRDLAMPMRINGVPVSLSLGTTADPGGGNFVMATLFKGRRNNTSQPVTGREYQYLIVAGILAGAELDFCERYCAAKAGVTF